MIGMFWLSRLSTDTNYLTGIALPMILIGIAKVVLLAPLPRQVFLVLALKTPVPLPALSTLPINLADPLDSVSL
ncbi:hypothetical protein [Neobacillus drentensis]|uniref:hypothetical protein n=1 Tax=Neobacillus drentensis TaxID=220684 RepID=UPI0030005C49